MLKIDLWKPCLSCPHVDAVIRTDVVRIRASDGKLRERSVITCGHAPVCARIDGAEPLIGCDAQ